MLLTGNRSYRYEHIIIPGVSTPLRWLIMMRWEVHDRYGNQIYMTEERWQHALEKRPWLSDYLGNVLVTLRQGRRRQDPLNVRKYKYYWPCPKLLPEFNHIIVVVLFGEKTIVGNTIVPNNYVTNVWAAFIYGKE